MKIITLLEDTQTSKGRLCAHSTPRLSDGECNGLIAAGKAVLYKEFSAVEKAEASAATADKIAARALADADRATRIAEAAKKKAAEKRAAIGGAAEKTDADEKKAAAARLAKKKADAARG